MIQNPGQITRPSIDLKVVLKRKLDKDFKKVGPICGNLSFKSQLMKVWEVLSFLGKFQLKTAQTYWHFFSVKLMWKSQKQHWNVLQSSVKRLIQKDTTFNLYVISITHKYIPISFNFFIGIPVLQKGVIKSKNLRLFH